MRSCISVLAAKMAAIFVFNSSLVAAICTRRCCCSSTLLWSTASPRVSASVRREDLKRCPLTASSQDLGWFERTLFGLEVFCSVIRSLEVKGSFGGVVASHDAELVETRLVNRTKAGLDGLRGSAVDVSALRCCTKTGRTNRFREIMLAGEPREDVLGTSEVIGRKSIETKLVQLFEKGSSCQKRAQ